MNFNIENMNFHEMKDVIKMMVRNFNHEHDRLIQLENKVLQLEILVNKLKNEKKIMMDKIINEK